MVQLVIMLHGLSASLRALTFGSTMGLVAFIMPAGAGGDVERYANMGESKVSYKWENPD